MHVNGAPECVRLYSVCEQAIHRYNYLIVVPNELTNREAFTVLALCSVVKHAGSG